MLVLHFFRHFIFSPRAGALIRRISWLSLTAITLSMSAFFIVLFVMNGMNNSIQTRLMALEPHLYLTFPTIANLGLIESHPVFQRLKETPENKAYLFESQDIIIRTLDGQFRGATARGISRESLSFMIDQLRKLDQVQAKKNENVSLAWDRDELPQEGEIIMGIDLARALGVFEGDRVTIIPPETLLLPMSEAPAFEKVKIRKIISTNLADLDAQFIFYQRGVGLKKLSHGSSVQRGIEVWTPDGNKVEGLQKNLEKFDGVQIENWKQRNSALFYALKLEKICIGLFLGLAGLIAGSSILTVLVLLLSQKKRDIAILRTIGLSGRRTVKIFTQLGALLAGVGIVAGTFVGTGLSFYIEKFPINVLPDIYYDSQIPALVDMKLVLVIFILALGLAFLGCWIPARSALEIEPTEALRAKN